MPNGGVPWRRPHVIMETAAPGACRAGASCGVLAARAAVLRHKFAPRLSSSPKQELWASRLARMPAPQTPPHQSIEVVATENAATMSLATMSCETLEVAMSKNSPSMPSGCTA